MNFTPTAEQTACQNAFNARANMVIQAGAGTGKTTTLKMLALSDTDRLGTYLAFNRSIAKEASQTFPRNVRCLTAHSLAFQEYGRQFSARLNASYQGWKPSIDFLDAHPINLRDHENKRRTLSAYQLTRLVLETVKAFCQSGDIAITSAHVPAVPGIDSPDASLRPTSTTRNPALVEFVLPRAIQAWEQDLHRTDGILPFDHGYYLKQWSLTGPKIAGDFLMFDEAQDANGAIAAVVNNQDHLQRVFVGDDSQAIMGFAGAHNAMRKFARAEGVEVLSLTESFRFGPTIAAAANEVLDALHAPLRISGTDAMASTIGTLDIGDNPASDAVLCRTNAGAFDEVISLQAQGRKVCLLGNADDIRRFIEAAEELMVKGSTNYAPLIAFESWSDVQDFVLADPSGADFSTLVEMVDEYGCDVLLKALRECTTENRADVVVSTAHKAKGREWDRVRIATDFSVDSELPRALLEPELMLAYVAITRARLVLDPGMLRDWMTTTVQRVRSEGAAQAGQQADLDSDPFATEETPGDAVAAGVPEHSDGSESVELPMEVWNRLVDAAQTWGGTPEEFAVRLLDGALTGLNR